MVFHQLEHGIPLLAPWQVGSVKVQPDYDASKVTSVWLFYHSQSSQEFCI